MIYCCQKTICISCLKEDHEGHKWVDIEDREKEVLTSNVTKIIKKLEIKRGTILKVKKDVVVKTDTCLKDLKEAKKQIDEMIKEAETQQNKTNLRVDEDVAVMTAEIKSLSDILESVRENKISPQTMKKKRETIQGLIENKSHSDQRCYQYPTFNVNRASVEEMLGRIGKGKISLVLPGPDDSEQELIPREIRRASQLRCTGLQLIFV